MTTGAGICTTASGENPGTGILYTGAGAPTDTLARNNRIRSCWNPATNTEATSTLPDNILACYVRNLSLLCINL